MSCHAYRFTAALFLLTTFSSYAHQPHSAQRIISLAPHTTELACSAGLCDQLIAVSEYSDYPEQVKSLEQVANYQGIKLERILTLQPDLVIAWPEGNPQRELDKLRDLGIPLYISTIHSLDDIARNIEELSAFSTNPQQGQNAAHHFRQQLDKLQQQYHHAVPVRYFYQLSHQPLITLGQDGWLSEIFQVCKGENVFAHSKVPYPQVSTEQVILAHPEVIFTTGSDHSPSNQTQQWQQWSHAIPAVAQQQIWSLTSDWSNRPTLRTLQGIQEICTYLDNARGNH